MIGYVTNNQILCENCYKYFVAYKNIRSQIDADDPVIRANLTFDDALNRLTCPFCKKEFTYETDLLIHSFKDKFAIYSSYTKVFAHVANFRVAAEICGMSDWNFRLCTYSYEAYEKLRIFTAGLDDAKITALKLKTFPKYKDMNIKAEYISFEYSDDTNLHFTHRDFTGKIIENYSLCKSDYDEMPDLSAEKGNWITLDKTWAIKRLEETK